MTTFLPLLAITFAVAIGTYLTGRMVIGAFAVRWLKRTTPENIIFSAVLGTAVWMLLTAWCSYLGIAAPQARLVIALVLAFLAQALYYQGNLYFPIRPTSSRTVLWLIGSLIFIAAMGMEEVLTSHGYNIFCDTTLYISSSEWLQTHSAGAKVAEDSTRPLTFIRTWFQDNQWFRTGAIYFSSLIQALFPRFSAVELFPAIMTWGLVLNIGGIYVVSRWVLRISQPFSLAGAIFAAACFNPFKTSVDEGFLCQMYGSAAIMAATAVLSRLRSARNQNWGSAAVFSITVAMQIMAYSEMSPILAISCFTYLVAEFIRAERKSRRASFLWFCAQTILMLGLAVNFEFVRGIRSVLCNLHMNGVGRNIPWSTLEFWSFALGVRPLSTGFKPFVQVATLIATICFFFGFIQLVRRRPQSYPLAAAVAVYACLAMYFHFFVPDFWTESIGHTWNQFKLCKWAFPLVVSVEAFGLYLLFRRFSQRRIVCGAFCLLIAATLIPMRLHDARKRGMGYRTIFQTNRPMQSLRELRDYFERSDSQDFYFIATRDMRVARPFFILPTIIGMRQCLNSWQQHIYCTTPALQTDQLARTSERTRFFMQGEPPFEAPLEKLPAGYSIVNALRPFVFDLRCHNGLEDGAVGKFCWIGKEPVEAVVWSPSEGESLLEFWIIPGPSCGDSNSRAIRVTKDGKTIKDLRVEGSSLVSIPISLIKGQNAVEIACLDEATNKTVSTQDPRILLAGLYGMSVQSQVTRGLSKESSDNVIPALGNHAAVISGD